MSLAPRIHLLPLVAATTMPVVAEAESGGADQSSASSSTRDDLGESGVATARPSTTTTSVAAPTDFTTTPQPTTDQRSLEPYLLPATLEVLGLFTVMRGTEAYLWPEPFSFRQIDQWPQRYERAFTLPPVFDSRRPFMQWDGDRWEINVIGHGLLGSELYLRPRRCGFSWLGSLGFAAAASTVWEYLIEGNGVRPSGVDLVYTPLSGLVFGEARYQAFRMAGKVHDPTLRSVFRIVIDPIGEFATSAVGSPC